MSLNSLWVEKYRPTSPDDYIFQNPEQARQVRNMIANHDINHLLLSGPAGTGKTSLAGLLIAQLDLDPADVLRINASRNNNAEYIRNTITSFAMSYPVGTFKVVRLEEADFLSPAAQGALRELMEETVDTCRFIFTCNYDNRIISGIKSRSQHFNIKAPLLKDVLERCRKILTDEGVQFKPEELEKYVAASYPDIRMIINNLQHHSHNSKLVFTETSSDGDYHFKLLDLLEAGDLKAIRKLVCENVQREEFDSVYRFLYENLHRVPLFKKSEKLDEAILLIASYLYKNALVADPEINFAACMIELGSLK